jgi:hypothetical protein
MMNIDIFPAMRRALLRWRDREIQRVASIGLFATLFCNSSKGA